MEKTHIGYSLLFSVLPSQKKSLLFFLYFFYSVIVLIIDYGRVATIEEILSTNLLSFYSVIVFILFFYLVAVKENNWVRSFQTLKGAYATKGNQWVSYNDVQFVKEKADYVIKNKYSGVAVFTMDMDDFNNNCCQVRFIEIKRLYISETPLGAFAHSSGMGIVLL